MRKRTIFSKKSKSWGQCGCSDRRTLAGLCYGGADRLFEILNPFPFLLLRDAYRSATSAALTVNTCRVDFSFYRRAGTGEGRRATWGQPQESILRNPAFSRLTWRSAIRICTLALRVNVLCADPHCISSMRIRNVRRCAHFPYPLRTRCRTGPTPPSSMSCCI